LVARLHVYTLVAVTFTFTDVRFTRAVYGLFYVAYGYTFTHTAVTLVHTHARLLFYAPRGLRAFTHWLPLPRLHTRFLPVTLLDFTFYRVARFHHTFPYLPFTLHVYVHCGYTLLPVTVYGYGWLRFAVTILVTLHARLPAGYVAHTHTRLRTTLRAFYGYVTAFCGYTFWVTFVVTVTVTVWLRLRLPRLHARLHVTFVLPVTHAVCTHVARTTRSTFYGYYTLRLRFYCTRLVTHTHAHTLHHRYRTTHTLRLLRYVAFTAVTTVTRLFVVYGYGYVYVHRRLVGYGSLVTRLRLPVGYRVYAHWFTFLLRLLR